MGVGTSFVKYFLFFVNLLFALGGLAILVLGVLILLKLNSVTSVLPSKYELTPWLFVIIGVIIFGIAFFGCCGAVMEGHCMLVSYAVCLLVIIIAQVALATLVFLYVDDTDKFLKSALMSSFDKAQGNTPGADTQLAREAFSALEVQFHCCGVEGPSNYGLGVLSDSCCADSEGILKQLSGKCTVVDARNRPGCLYATSDFAKKYGKPSAWVAIAIAAVELLGAIFALCLANSIRNEERRSHY